MSAPLARRSLWRRSGRWRREGSRTSTGWWARRSCATSGARSRAVRCAGWRVRSERPASDGDRRLRPRGAVRGLPGPDGARRGSFTARVAEDGAQIRGLRTWRPNEAGVAVYKVGVGRRHLAWTAAGTGGWSRSSPWWARRSSRCVRLAGGDLLERWEARAGSVTLMRAPGLAGVRDGRPYHAVHGPPRGTQYQLALRMRVDRP